MSSSKKKEDVDLIAAAAAKLALQQLDPAAKKHRQEFSCGLPQAVISFHLRQLLQLNKDYIFNTMYVDKKELYLYLRIRVQNIMKSTKIFRINRTQKIKKTRKFFERRETLPNLTPGTDSEENQDISLNQIKSFSFELSRKQKDPSNTIDLEIRIIDKSAAGGEEEVSLCSAELHIYDFLKEMYASRLIPMEREQQRNAMAFLEFDYVMRYGIFGYGYSQQLSQRDIPVATILKECLLMRVPAPPSRKDHDGFLLPAMLPKPTFIPFSEKDDDEPTATSTRKNKEKSRESQSGSTFFTAKDNNVEIVQKLIKRRKRLQRMKQNYMKLTTRNERIKFLTSLVSNQAGEKSGQGGSVFFDADLDFPPDEDDSYFSKLGEIGRIEHEPKTVIGNLSPLLNMASSLHRRSRPEMIKQRPTNLEPGTSYDQKGGYGTELSVPNASDNYPATEKKEKGKEKKETGSQSSLGQPQSQATAKKYIFKWISGVNSILKSKQQKKIHPSEDEESQHEDEAARLEAKKAKGRGRTKSTKSSTGMNK